jgi:hypothetical protein
MMQNEYVQQIYIDSPSWIYLSTSYCNATLESTTGEADPYPYRFMCSVMNSGYVRIIKQDKFPEWNAAMTAKKVVVYLKYTINQNQIGGNTGNWYAYGINHLTSTSSTYQICRAHGNFYVDDFLSPYIYKINFPTLSFSKRTCRTNEVCMFYGYLLPSTLSSEYTIGYMDYVLPSEFGYSNLIDYTACVMEEKNDDVNPVTCKATRNDSDVTVRFDPTYYNHNYKLISIDTSNAAQLFTSPEFPGAHYRMKVNLYTTANVLIESQYVNITTVYGELLTFNDIEITIPEDADAIGIYEVTFKVGDQDILPSYPNTASNRVTSAI